MKPNPIPTPIQFDPEYPDQAYAEGWCVSQCSGSQYTPEDWFALQRLEEVSYFNSDWEALAYVTKQAAAGSEYHRSAMLYMEQQNFKLLRDARGEAVDNHNKWVDLCNSF